MSREEVGGMPAARPEKDMRGGRRVGEKGKIPVQTKGHTTEVWCVGVGQVERSAWWW